MTTLPRLALCAALLAAAGCATRGGPRAAAPAPRGAEARAYHYSDDQGLTAVTVGGAAEQAFGDGHRAFFRAVADNVRVTATPDPLPAAPGGGHDHGGHPGAHDDLGPLDVVTSASAVAGGGRAADKWRFEGSGGVELHRPVAGNPSRLTVHGRVSDEVDYRAWSGGVRLATELFERNTQLALSLGYGHDRVVPVEAPPGQADRWPATHERVFAAASTSQVLTRTLVLHGGVAATWQRGTLASPYRRAMVQTTLFPEAVPDARDRYTASVGVSWSLLRGLALHLRQGAYADDWGVRALVPEGAVAAELGRRGLLRLRYRYYRQTRADFYAPRYREVARHLSGDPRLGEVVGHGPAADLEWRVLGGPFARRYLAVRGGYELMHAEYPLLGRTARGHVVSGGFLAGL